MRRAGKGAPAFYYLNCLSLQWFHRSYRNPARAENPSRQSAFLLQLTSAILASEPGRYNQLLQKQVSGYIRDANRIPGQQCVSRLPFAQIGPAVQRLCCRLAQNQ